MTHVDNGLLPSLYAVLQKSSRPNARGLFIELHGNAISEGALEQLASQLLPGSQHRVECGLTVLEDGVVHCRSLPSQLRPYTNPHGHNELCLIDSGIDCEGAAEIAGLLADDQFAVEVLRLGKNSMSDLGISVLAEALASNSWLRCLSFSKNNIRQPAPLFSALFQTNSSLQSCAATPSSMTSEVSSSVKVETACKG